MHNVNVRVFWSIVHLFIYNIQITFLTLSEFWLSLAFKTVNQLSVDVSHSDVGETFLIGGQRFSLTIVNFHLGQPKIVHYISGLKDFFLSLMGICLDRDKWLKLVLMFAIHICLVPTWIIITSDYYILHWGTSTLSTEITSKKSAERQCLMAPGSLTKLMIASPTI